MSPREQKLLTFFALAGFVMLNFIGVSYYRSKQQEVESGRLRAERELRTAELFQASRDEALEEMEWLESHEPKPAENQDVQVALQALCTVEAQKSGLTIKDQDLLPSDTATGKRFHRAKIRLVVTGTEQALYNWFDRINVPDQLRGATRIILSPNKQDDVQIDCTVTIEQWFIPASPSA